jgi:hypothetical protein
MGLREALNMRLLGGEVTADKYARFNSLRFKLISHNSEYEKFLGTKSKALRMLVSVFVEHPSAIMKLAEKVDKDE